MSIMELKTWRDAVPYGAYLQPIHLKMTGPNESHVSTSVGPKLSPQSAPKSQPESTETFSNGTPTLSQHLETPTDLVGTQNGDQSMDKTTNVTAIPPFTSKCLDTSDKMALNVGGPVWAMDWLPSKPAANAATIVVPKQGKVQRVSTASKSGTKKSVKNVNGAASAGSAETQEDAKLEWRFLALTTHPPCQVEDGKVVKPTPPDHYYDMPESARNLIQIWAVPVQRPIIIGKAGQRGRSKIAGKRLIQPRMVYAIDHDSGVAWDLQWCPLVKKFPKADYRSNALGVLAVCFGDGSLRVFEIPAILEERLQSEVVEKADRIVEKSIPLVVAKLPRIMQLSVQWSPHNWNMLLTGGSDGSVSLWNIETAVRERESLSTKQAEPEPIEPQRRFQDADTIGKQEAFDWGSGWVAIRAVAWSPFDEHIFATTGNDSVFKVWDVREPRVCLRSHRIRSTWGLALQWMNQTSIQISGDQGSVYMYDILSGSYQKLHFHPQVDSPVWDVQFARRGAVPLLMSSCTSGSVRAAPAKRLYRVPQNCVEICRLSGEKDSSIEKPFKSLTVSFEKRSESADSGSSSTREFCERDAALHRLRLSSCTAGDYPCFLATGGHAGLVILLEVQELLDTLISTFFLKKIGRPRKVFATVGSHIAKNQSTKHIEGKPKAARPKARTLGSFVDTKRRHTVLSKGNMKLLRTGKGKAKSHAKPRKKSFIQKDGQVEVDDCVEDEEEPEFKEEDEEEEDESDLSVIMEDSSDEDHNCISDDDIEEEAETSAAHVNMEEARLMKEYQLDLSEEDAYLLALQVSTADSAPAVSTLETDKDAPKALSSPVIPEELQKNESSAKDRGKANPKDKAANMMAKAIAATKEKPTAKSGKGKRRARTTATPASTAASVVDEAHCNNDIGANQKNTTELDGSDKEESKASSIVALALKKKKSTTMKTDASAAIPKKAKTKAKQPKKVAAKKASSTSKEEDSMSLLAINQARVLQAFEYQMGMSEEDALKEAIRLSQSGNKRRSSRGKPSGSHFVSGTISGTLPTPTQPKQTPATPRTKKPSQTRQKNKVKESKEDTQMNDTEAVPADEDAQHQRPQTPRRLQFSPPNGSESGDQSEIPAGNIDGGTPAVPVDAVATQKKLSPPKLSATELATTISKPSLTPPSIAATPQTASAPSVSFEEKQPASTDGKKVAKRAKSTRSKAASSAKRQKTSATASQSGQRKSDRVAQSNVLSEEDDLLLALKMSEIEY